MKSNISQGSAVRTPQGTGIPDINRMNSDGYAGTGGNAPKTKKTRKQKILKVIAYILLCTFGLTLGAFVYGYQLLGKVGYTAVAVVNKDDYDTVDIGSLDNLDAENGDTTSSWAQGGHTKVYVDENFPIKKVAQKDPNVENILVFGVDSRGTDDVDCRADAVMIVSLDTKTKTIKLISLMRDCGVTIEGRSSTDKLTHSYAYGGVGLLINTINDNFGLDVQRFVMLDFSSSSDLIDMVGGIDIDVQPIEVKYANESINEENMLMGTSAALLTNSGVQTLDGIQAIAWSRIRHADSDFVRTSRQRTVATTLMKKVASMNTIQQLAFLKNSAGLFETNMTQADLFRLGTVGVSLVGHIVEYRIPDDNLYTIQEDPWMMLIDWEQQIPRLHEYIWGTSAI